MLYPYKMESESSKLLAKALGKKRIKTEGSSFKGNESKIIINWGASNLPKEVEKCEVLNKASAVKIASDKLAFFSRVDGTVTIPEYTKDPLVAAKWHMDGKTVVGRTILNGHSGKGIVVIDQETNWANVDHAAIKLYVQYIRKKDEYRVHVVNGEVIDIRRKAVKADMPKEAINWQVRNHANGFIFAKDGFEAPEDVLLQSLKAVHVCGLTFGAVDVMWNAFYEKAYVLEINTAPGLEGSSVDNYAKGFQKIYDAGVLALKERQLALDKIHMDLNEGKIDGPKAIKLLAALD